MRDELLAVMATDSGDIFEHPYLRMAGAAGEHWWRIDADYVHPLPGGSRLFTLPHAQPVGYDVRQGRFVTVERLPRSWGGDKVQAVSAFPAPGYMRTLLPAAAYTRATPTLPLWAYTAVGWSPQDNCFYAAAVPVDDNSHWDPQQFDDRQVAPAVEARLQQQPQNRLLQQLARCALDYHCFAAKNLFLQRWEAPLPTSPTCNARCIGCLSWQEQQSNCPASQERIDFVPTVQEQCEVAVPHLQQAPDAIVSYGQGCEGDPILQVAHTAPAIKKMRQATGRGTLNFNSNASRPQAVAQLAEAGLDSLRVSLNSAQRERYRAYHRPRDYGFTDVIQSLRVAKDNGLWLTLNYLVFPGITDQQAELEALAELVAIGGVDLIQLRNLSLDPRLYLGALSAHNKERPLGLPAFKQLLEKQFPHLQWGYFNRPKEQFRQR